MSAEHGGSRPARQRWLSAPAFHLAAAARALSLITRTAISVAAREPLATIPFHHCMVSIALAIQWAALLCRRAGTPDWKGQSYPAVRS